MRAAVLAILASLTLAACGSGPSDEEQIRDLLADLGRATAAKDYDRLCDRIFAPALIEEIKQIGLPCQIAMQNALEDVKNPRLTVGKVRVEGRRASAEVRSSAEGQEPSRDIVELVKNEDDEWRVGELAGASPPSPNE